MKSSSLKRRIGIFITGMMIVVVIIISVIAYREFQEALIGSLDARLQSDMNTVKYLLKTEELFTPEARKEVLAFLRPQTKTQGVAYQIWLENVNTSTTDLKSMDIYQHLLDRRISPPKPNDYLLTGMTEGQTTYRVIWARYPVSIPSQNGTETLNIMLATSSTYAYHETAEFLRVLLVVGAIILWITFGLIQAALKWGLKPVNTLARQMNDISGSNLAAVRHTDPDLPKELIPFVTAWQEMINKLAHAMAEQKRFTSDAAHELRTPITLIKSTLQLAQSQKRSPAFYEDTISQALEDIERLNALIEQLLQLARMEKEDVQNDREVIAMQELIRDTVEHYESLAREKGFRFDLRMAPAAIRGNPHQIRQLLLNLIDNAIKYAPPGTPITVSVTAADTTVIVTVHDEGGGIPPREHGRLFDRFYRVGTARDRNSGGSGLGLAIAKEIVLLHAGDITVTSTPEDGTRFIVVLPIYKKYG